MERGVQQGCPLSCHLFNLVGQLQIYSLRQQGFFAWWSFNGDPCSLYADDMAIFILDLSQLHGIIQHLQYLGQFTGLMLNLDKTLALGPNVKIAKVAGVCVDKKPVKYLGTFLGVGDLSDMNFENALIKVRGVAAKWQKRNLTLPS